VINPRIDKAKGHQTPKVSHSKGIKPPPLSLTTSRYLASLSTSPAAVQTASQERMIIRKFSLHVPYLLLLLRLGAATSYKKVNKLA